MSGAAAVRAVELVARRARLDTVQDLQRSYLRMLGAAEERAARWGAGGTGPTPSGRLLREWYLTCHAASLAAGLGRPTTTPEGLAVEAVADRVGRTRAGTGSLEPQRATLVLLRLAAKDAAVATRDVHQGLVASAPDRAACYLGRRPGFDEVRTSVLQHWYQRCYLAALDAELGLQPPLQTVTPAEAGQVARCVVSRQPWRIIGPDGVPLVSARIGAAAHHAADETGPGPGSAPPWPALTDRTARARVADAWDRAEDAVRTRWTQDARVAASTAVARRWVDLPGPEQSRLTAHWLSRHQTCPAEQPSGPPVPGPPRIAAAVMFNQPPRPAAPDGRARARRPPRDDRGESRPATPAAR